MTRRRLVRGAWSSPLGFALVEMIVVMAVLGMTFGVSALAFTSLKGPRESAVARELHRARSEAIRTGRPVVTSGNHAPLTPHLLFLPDGRAIGPGADPLTGAPIDSAR